MSPLANTGRHAGFSMIEVLVTLVILLTGLLGLAGLMAQSQRSEMESYQRVQAVILLQDIENRINANRKAAVCYRITTNVGAGTPYLGTGSAITPVPPPPTAQCSAATIQAIYPTMPAAAAATAATTAVADLNAWNNALLGAAESTATGPTGAMIGARGCISYDSTQEVIDPTTAAPIPGSGIYTLSVAWQGTGDTSANTGFLCGTGLYGSAAGATDTKRRVIGLTMRIASLK